MCIQNAICFPFKRISNNCSARSLISQKPSQKKDYKAHVGIASQACLTADFIVGATSTGNPPRKTATTSCIASDGTFLKL